MATVTHAGRTVITENEGGWFYKPGHKGNAAVPVRLARSSVAMIKNMGKAPAEHALTIDYEGTEADMSQLRSRLTTLYDHTVGDLDVPGWPTVARTVFVGQPVLSQPIALINNKYLITLELRLLEL